MKLLNVGCGRNFHPKWINVDFSPSSPNIISFDLRRGLPFPNDYFDAVYHSHVLEHLTQEEAKKLMQECWRVLKPNSVLRVVVPDLESIVENYLAALQQIESGVKEAESNYDWMMLELYDQAVRSFRGGQMLKYMKQKDLKNKEFIISRSGLDAINIFEEDANNYKKRLWQKLKSQKPLWFIQQFRNMLAAIFVYLIAGNNARVAFQEGLFRNSGEIHRWMYDRFSLRLLLEKTGFKEVIVCRADQSRIPDFNSYNLDVIDGQIRKPNSLFMEGIKKL
ncbi:MAG: methyltransferase domain-containing protein [Nitrososphaeria archaeon]